MIGSFAIRGHVTVLVAPPGAGKSTLAAELAVAAATGCGELVGEIVHEPVKAWLWNNEDDLDELKRRLAAVLQQWSIDFAELRHRIGLNSGVLRQLIVARPARDGTVARLPDLDAVAEQVTSGGIGLLIVDPFVSTHQCDENDNAQILAVAGMWREIAQRCNCAVLLVHHTGKPPMATADGWAGSLSASRGASSLGGVARIMRTLFAMSPRDAEQLGIPAMERRLWVRLDDAKANLALAAPSARWFRRVSVTIANGDDVGVLVPDDPRPEPGEVPVEAIRLALLEEIDKAWFAGKPLSQRPQAGDRHAVRAVAKRGGWPMAQVEKAMFRLMADGSVRDEMFSAKSKQRGLRVVPFDERTVPPGHGGDQ